MLERLLRMLAEGGTRTPTQLANQLGVSQSLVEQMLADLSRMGYLRPIDGLSCRAPSDGESTPCSGCPAKSACSVGEPAGQVWALTHKRPAALQTRPTEKSDKPQQASRVRSALRWLRR
jgi:DNA-binding transcriptional MocR family regulator